MRILVVGGTGFLGSYIIKGTEEISDISAIGASLSGINGFPLDITKEESIRTVLKKYQPDCVINCAAITNVDKCESNPQLAKLINSIGPKNLSKITKENGLRLIHISTDSIFDGISGDYTEEAKPCPVNIYAQTKLEGEIFVSEIASNYSVIRTNFYGINLNQKHLLNYILSNLLEDKEIVGFDDIKFNPLWIRDLACCVLELVKNNFQGIIHCAGNERITKYDFIRKVASGLGYENPNIKRGSLKNASLIAKRPYDTTLNNNRMLKLLKTKIHSLDEVLRDSSFDIYRSKKSTKK